MRVKYLFPECEMQYTSGDFLNNEMSDNVNVGTCVEKNYYLLNSTQMMMLSNLRKKLVIKHDKKNASSSHIKLEVLFAYPTITSVDFL